LVYTLSFDYLSFNYSSISKSFSIFILIFFVALQSLRPVNKNLIIYALLFSSVGDFFLTWNNQQGLSYGILCFSSAHIFFCLTFLRYIQKPYSLDTYQKLTFTCIIIIAAAVTAILGLYISTSLKFLVYFYILVISAMILSATAISPFPSLIFLGALLFGSSDILLGISLFMNSYFGEQYWIWISYYFAQIFIIIGCIQKDMLNI